MKYFFLVLAAFVIAGFALVLFSRDAPESYTIAVNHQANPFGVKHDSAAKTWQRGKDYLNNQKRLISGGSLRQNDTMLFIPYYNDYHKGNMLRITRRDGRDSSWFSIAWYYSGSEVTYNEQKVAYYMTTGISEYMATYPEGKK